MPVAMTMPKYAGETLVLRARGMLPRASALFLARAAGAASIMRRRSERRLLILPCAAFGRATVNSRRRFHRQLIHGHSLALENGLKFVEVALEQVSYHFR